MSSKGETSNHTGNAPPPRNNTNNNHQRSKSSVIKAFIHRRTNSEGIGLPSSFSIPSEIFNINIGNSGSTVIDSDDMLLSKPLGELQQNQQDGPLRSPHKATRDDQANDGKTGFTLKKSKRDQSPVKPKKTKSATNLGGLLSKPKSLKNLKKFAADDEKSQRDKENRQPNNSSGADDPNPPPIYAQFCSTSTNIFAPPQFPQHNGTGGSGRPSSYQHPSGGGYRFDIPNPAFAMNNSHGRSSMEVTSRRPPQQESGVGSTSGGSHRPHRGSRPISIAHPPPRSQSKSDLRQPKANEPYIDPREIDMHLEAMLDRRNIPENQRYKMRSLADSVKMEFIRQDWAETAGKSNNRTTSGGGPSPTENSDTSNGEIVSPQEESQKGSKGKKTSRAKAALTLSKPKKSSKDSSGSPASPTKRSGMESLGRHLRSKSTDSIVSALDRPASSGSAGSNKRDGGAASAAASLLAKVTGRGREATGAADFVAYVRKVQRPEQVEVGKIHKLRLLLRNETVAWTEEFIQLGGMKEIVELLHRIMEVEWREEHEDALLHETLLCLKALCTIDLALGYLHEIQGALFPALLRMLFDPEKKGPSEFTTRSIITTLLFTYIETGPTFPERTTRAATVLSYLRDPEPPEPERPVGFVLEMRKDRPYRVWCKEVVSVTKEVFWIFLHNLNVVALPGESGHNVSSLDPKAVAPPIAESPYMPSPQPLFPLPGDALTTYVATHFPRERPPVPAAPYVGGVEWDATNYIASHLDLLNAILACTPSTQERNALRAQLRISGWERCLGGSLRLCKEKFYGAVHDGLRTWVAAAHADAWDVRDVRFGPPAAESRSASPVKKPTKKKEEPVPKIEMPRLDFEAGALAGGVGGSGYRGAVPRSNEPWVS